MDTHSEKRKKEKKLTECTCNQRKRGKEPKKTPKKHKNKKNTFIKQNREIKNKNTKQHKPTQSQIKVQTSANCACAVPLIIDGLGFFMPLVARGESGTVVDSMRESIHALRCDFLCLQDTQSERTRWR